MAVDYVQECGDRDCGGAKVDDPFDRIGHMRLAEAVPNRTQRKTNMSIFDDLNAEFKTWRDRYFEDERASVRFAHQFANGLKSYIGAPNVFKRDMSRDTTETAPYVKVCKLVDNGDGTYSAEDTDNFYDIIQKRGDGYWGFAISVALETGANTYQKQYFSFQIHFIIDDNVARLKITSRPDGELTYDLNDDTKNAAAYNFVVKLVRETLKTKPSDLVHKKTPMGFIVPLSDG